VKSHHVAIYPIIGLRDQPVSLAGMDLLGGAWGGGGGVRTPLALARGGAGGVPIFMIKQKIQNEIQ
jgi:hypothetical protein